jgi:hypothetical protein
MSQVFVHCWKESKPEVPVTLKPLTRIVLGSQTRLGRGKRTVATSNGG